MHGHCFGPEMEYGSTSPYRCVARVRAPVFLSKLSSRGLAAPAGGGHPRATARGAESGGQTQVCYSSPKQVQGNLVVVFCLEPISKTELRNTR